ncbi:MAG: DUF1232 domain-containing protein [Bacteroidales bacterium]|nr:DUF1232 domain-containing protein [Bacteroidales bacterium]
MNTTPNKNDLANSEKYYSEDGLFKKISDFATRAGIKVIYRCLLLYSALISSKTPLIYRGIIVGALGYFICPIDIVPDFIPSVGFIDDLAALTSVLLTLSNKNAISPESRNSAKEQLKKWFESVDESQWDSLDKFE